MQPRPTVGGLASRNLVLTLLRLDRTHARRSEIADRQFNAQDSKGPRSFSRFLIRLAETSPRLVLKQIVLLQKHLDSEVRRNDPQPQLPEHSSAVG